MGEWDEEEDEEDGVYAEDKEEEDGEEDACPCGLLIDYGVDFAFAEGTCCEGLSKRKICM